jgi:uncharacterized membrane protein
MINKINFMQKKGFLLRDFVVAGILFGIIIALLIIQVASVAQNYNNQDIISPAFASHYSTLQQNLNNLDTSNKAVQGSGGLNLIGTFNVAFNSIFTVIKMVWDSVLIYTGMATNVASDFTFLDKTTVLMFLGGIIAILTTYLVFVWLSSVSRGKI